MRMSRHLGNYCGGSSWRNEYTEYDFIRLSYEFDYVMRIPTPVTSKYIKMVSRIRADEDLNLYAPIVLREIGYPGNFNRLMYGLYQYGSNMIIYNVSGANSGFNRFSYGQWIDLEFIYTETDGIIRINGIDLDHETYSLDQPVDCGARWTLFGKPDLVVSGSYSPNTQNPWNGTLQKVKFFDPSTNALLADLRPVKRNSDQQVGLFDISSKTFCIPTGQQGEVSSVFTVGNL